jgi:hypothetical protein
MPVRLVPCKHKDTGAPANIAETALQHFPAYEPVDPDDRKRLGYDKTEDEQPTPAGQQPPASDAHARKSKPAPGAAKKNEE